MSSIIKQHNTKILSNSNNIQNRLCNCRNRNDCPLNGNCFKKCFAYKVEVTTDQSFKIYFGASEGEFKSRYNNHTLSFRNKHHANDTELSNHLGELKNANINFSVIWSIAACASPYRCDTRKCDLCLTEKYIIARADQKYLLNKRTEITETSMF